MFLLILFNQKIYRIKMKLFIGINIWANDKYGRKIRKM